MMINYSKGKIYTIICRYDPKLVYVGQSTQSLAQRWGEHKRDYRQGNHLLFYKQIQDVNDGILIYVKNTLVKTVWTFTDDPEKDRLCGK
jgi:hypothetical protein